MVRPTSKANRRQTAGLSRTLRAGLTHHRAGRFHRAEALYRKVLEKAPSCVDALHLLGVVAFDFGQFQRAVELIELALPALDRLPEIHLNYGNALYKAGRRVEAVESYRRAIALKPDFGMAYSNLSAALNDLRSFETGLEYSMRAVELIPDFPGAHSNCGAALLGLNRFAEAEIPLRRALDLLPGQAEIHNNLGVALQQLGRLDEAMAHYEQAIMLSPRQARLHKNLGGALEAMGALDEAMGCYERALALEPDYAEAHLNRSLLLLLRGDFAKGWAEFEWRWLCRGAPAKRAFDQPEWCGEALAGKTILVYSEHGLATAGLFQGFGDAIQFLRYVPMIAERGGTTVLELPGPLIRLAGNMPGVVAALPQGDPLPGFDLQCPLLSLPHAFRTRLDTIPSSVPYLMIDPDAGAAWAKRLSHASGIKVGLVWSGNPNNALNFSRSVTMPVLAPLWAVAGVSWFSLQVGERVADLAAAPAQTVEDLSPLLQDFVDTAAAIWHLDLVITVETAVAHLAGALGRPVWVPLSFMPGWRWLLGRDDSPWYPTMRLFRQHRHGDWDEVFRRIAAELAGVVSGERNRLLPEGRSLIPTNVSICSSH